MTWMRAIAAAGLSVFLPGSGHALLRDWVRALLFAGLYVFAVAAFLPMGELSAAGSTSAMMDAITEGTSRMDQFVVSFVVMFAAIDAGFRALDLTPGPDGDGEGPSCPSCGRELDEEIDFCHWCTTRIEVPEDRDG